MLPVGKLIGIWFPVPSRRREPCCGHHRRCGANFSADGFIFSAQTRTLPRSHQTVQSPANCCCIIRPLTIHTCSYRSSALTIRAKRPRLEWRGLPGEVGTTACDATIGPHSTGVAAYCADGGEFALQAASLVLMDNHSYCWRQIPYQSSVLTQCEISRHLEAEAN